MSERRISACSTCRHWSEDDDPGDDGCCVILLNTPNVRGFRTMPDDACVKYEPGFSLDEKDVCDLIETGIQRRFLTGSNEYVASRARAEIQRLREQLATVQEQTFDAGFSISGEGWNGEYPAGIMDTDSYKERRKEAIEALAAKGVG